MTHGAPALRSIAQALTSDLPCRSFGQSMALPASVHDRASGISITDRPSAAASDLSQTLHFLTQPKARGSSAHRP